MGWTLHFEIETPTSQGACQQTMARRRARHVQGALTSACCCRATAPAALA